MEANWVQDEAQWELHKPVLQYLYLEEGKTIHEVTKIMRIEHGFRATKDMYKRRFSRWKFTKYVKEREALAIIRKKRERDVAGKLTTFQRGNCLISVEDVERHLNRKFSSHRKLLEAIAVDPPTPDGLECLTPQDIPSSPRIPAKDLVYGKLFTKVRDYFSGSFEGGIWIKQADGLDCFSIRPGGGRMEGLKQLFTNHDLACQLLHRGSFDEAGRLLVSASATLRDLILAEHPRTLTALLDLSYHLLRQSRFEIAKILFNQAAGLGAMLLAPQHPLRVVCELVSVVNRDEFHAYLENAWEYALDQFELHLGALHYTTIRCRLEYIQMVIAQDDQYRAEIEVRRLLDLCGPIAQLCDSRTLKLLDTLAELLMDQGNYHEAEEIGKIIVAGARSCTAIDEDRLIDLTCSGLFLAARAQSRSHKLEEALSSLGEAIEICSHYRGKDHPLALKYMVNFEEWSAAWDMTLPMQPS